ncbi:MAG: hypothetical protein IKM32_02490 [Clostridia bacterium]|nr:hypothetical protein [Clostridia bacterium]
MQEQRINSVTKSVNPRNIKNNGTANGKRSSAVVKSGTKSVSAKRAANLRAVRAPRIVNVKKKDKAPFPWSIVVVSLILTGLFLFMMMNYAEVDKYRSEITELNNKLASMEKTQDELEVTLSNKYDIGEIEKYATEELGMTKTIPESNIHIITTEQEDKTEMHSYDDGEEGGFGFLLTGLGEVIRDFLN